MESLIKKMKQLLMNLRLRSTFYICLLSVILLVFTFFVNVPRTSYGATYEDVQKCLADHPAPTGCYNWIRSAKRNCQITVQVLQRCGGGEVIEKQKMYCVRGVDSGYQGSEQLLAFSCDGVHTDWLPAGTSAYSNGYYYTVSDYCDGHSVKSEEMPPTSYNNPCVSYPAGLGGNALYFASADCLFSTSVDNHSCADHDTALCTFGYCDKNDPYCRDKCLCAEDICCSGKGKGDGTDGFAGK